MITWQCKYFSDLGNWELYKILQLRNEVFVVEQNCVYQDCDNKDLKAYHYIGRQNGNVVAYSRLLEKGISYDDAASIGRVIIAQSIRGKSLARLLMRNSITEIYRLFGKVPIRIGAQFYLKKFYESFDFVQTGNPYLEDGIKHVSMIRQI